MNRVHSGTGTLKILIGKQESFDARVLSQEDQDFLS